MSYEEFFQNVKNYTDEVVIKNEQIFTESEKLKDEFISKLSHKIKSFNISDKHPLAQHLNIFNEELNNIAKEVNKEWEYLLKSNEFANRFSDKIIFFVFGKVNAGKSSFSNLFIKLSNMKHKFFYLDNESDEIKRSDKENFKVGQTETTSTIQWVEIGGLVLVDSPGLYSVTKANGELTKKFLDSADLLIWLTSSSSPGQMQELEELIKEIKKAKPIMPVITKSDEYEYDEDENGEIIKVLNPKSDEIRKKQELDVEKRAEEFLKSQSYNFKIITPVSISVLLSEKKRIEESNIEKLFDVLNKELLPQAIKYKKEKSRMIIKKFFEEKISNELIENKILVYIKELVENIEKEKDKLNNKRELLKDRIKSNVSDNLYSLVNKYKNSKNKIALISELEEFINQVFNKEVNKVLKEMFNNIKNQSIKINSSNIGDFEDIEVSVTIKGGKKGVFEFLWDVVTKFEFSFEKPDREKTKVIGTDITGVYSSLQKEINSNVDKSVDSLIEDFNKQFDELLLNVKEIQESINEFNNKLKGVYNEI